MAARTRNEWAWKGARDLVARRRENEDGVAFLNCPGPLAGVGARVSEKKLSDPTGFVIRSALAKPGIGGLSRK